MINKLRIALCIALALGIFRVLPASSEPPLTISMSQVDLTDFPSVAVQFSAWDENGIPLADLSPDHIFIQEGDLAEIHPDAVVPNDEAALSVALVLDVSGSMEGQPLSDAKHAAYRFLDRLNARDQAAVIAFSDNVNTDAENLDETREVGFSAQFEPAYDLIEGLTAAGNTELYNAVEKAVKITSALPPGHRAVLLFTDGRNEPADAGDPDSAISLAMEAGIPVFIIGLGNAIDETYLTRLAAETGGLYRQTPRSSELSGLFYEMATLLKTTYTLRYTSSLAPDGGLHPFGIRINAPQGSANTTASIGPLPQAQPSPTASSSPVPTITATAAAASVETPAPPPPESWLLQNKVALFLAGAVLLAAIIVWLDRLRRKHHDLVVKCANCGAILTEHGPCPICQGTERLEVRKE